MLKKIVLFLTDKYKNQLEASKEYSVFIEDMRYHGVEVKSHGIEEGKVEISVADILYLSDDADKLAWLQKKGGYTMAVYHEGVTGILPGTQFAIEGIEGAEWEYLYKIYQRFVGEPWHIAETKRCRLREMCVEDVDDLYELYDSPLVTRYTEPLFEERKKEIQYIRDYIENVYKYYGFGIWLIHRKKDGQLIGRAGFHYRAGYEEAELGFVIGEPFWRNGYAYEVCDFLMHLAQNVYDLGRVQALVNKGNEASIRLLEKLGFAYVEEVMVDGQEYRRYLSELAISKNTTYNS